MKPFDPAWLRKLSVIAVLSGCLPTMAIAAESNVVDANDIVLEFHPLRAANNSKRAGDSLKPDLSKAEFLPVEATLRMHVHADGALSYSCDEQHESATAAKLQTLHESTEQNP